MQWMLNKYLVILCKLGYIPYIACYAFLSFTSFNLFYIIDIYFSSVYHQCTYFLCIVVSAGTLISQTDKLRGTIYQKYYSNMRLTHTIIWFVCIIHCFSFANICFSVTIWFRSLTSDQNTDTIAICLRRNTQHDSWGSHIVPQGHGNHLAVNNAYQRFLYSKGWNCR